MLSQFMGNMNQPRQPGSTPAAAPSTPTTTPGTTAQPTSSRTTSTPTTEVNQRTPAQQTATQQTTAAIPEEWQTKLNQDKERQSTQQPQRPFSDAYLDGQPLSKKRKANERDSISLEKRLERAIQKTPNAGHPEAASLISSHASKTLLHQYYEQIAKDVTRCAATNPNYTSERFPATASLCASVPLHPTTTTTTTTTGTSSSTTDGRGVTTEQPSNNDLD
eukprot:TRINITY_DN745_c0_g1_i3.p1 TRINITY_DN745_c0_g1~~TRINITY_DN745_c0_g1_i3.p1  ORF type:complete len:230 (-),score=51.48 TRINITY_DN745_c0_g1_i3:35-694(-)